MENIQKKLTDLVKTHDLENLNILLKNNKEIDLNFTDNRGRNLLHYAASTVSEKGLPLIQVLLEKKIDPCALNENFESPMDIARNINNIPSLSLMKYFVLKQNQELQSYL